MEITHGRKQRPFNVLLMGMPGIGKSTWAASAPKPIFIGGEEHDDTDADSLPQATKYKDLTDQLDWLYKTKHDYKTIVVDTLDSVESLIHEKILASDSKQTGSINRCHGGYGAGNDMAEKELIKFKGKLKRLRDDKGMNVVILCHTKTKKTTDPVLGADYDEFKLYLQEKAEAVFVDWVSAVLFATYITHKKDGDTTNKTYAFGGGERIILTEKRPGHLAKNRYELPYELEMPLENPIGPFLDGYNSFYEGKKRPVEQVKASVIGLLDTVEDTELKNKVLETLEKAGSDYKKLEAIEKRLKERLK